MSVEVWWGDASMISQMTSIEGENHHLKKMFDELSMQNDNPPGI